MPIGVLLLVANTINIGADIGAMGDATKLSSGRPSLVCVMIFGGLCAALQVFMKYQQYVGS